VLKDCACILFRSFPLFPSRCDASTGLPHGFKRSLALWVFTGQLALDVEIAVRGELLTATDAGF
jgi:hypothetical protein